jgi:hypothetical protein
MAGEASKGFPRDEPDEHNPTGFISDSIDAMVSSFLENLTDIYSETKQVYQPDVDGDNEILPPAEPDKTNQILPSDEAIRAKSKLILDEIRDEDEETSIKREHLNSQTIPATDQREVIEKPSSLLPTEEAQLLSEFASPLVAEPDASQSVAKPVAPKPVGKSALTPPVIEPPEPPSIESAEEEMWRSLEIFRSRDTYSTPSFFQRQKHLIFASAAMALIIALGGLYFLWSEEIPSVSEISGQIQNSIRQHAQDSEKQISSALPPLDSSSAALADEAKDTATPSPAKETRLPQGTGPTGALVQKRSEEKSKTPARPISNRERAGWGFYNVSQPVTWVEISSKPSESESSAQEQPTQRTTVPKAAGASPASKPQVSQGITSSAPPASQSLPGTVAPHMRAPASSDSAPRDPASPSSREP